MDYLNLIDGPSAAIVLGGTVLGTILRCGVWRSFAAMRGLASTMRNSFDPVAARTELALQIQDIRRDGLLRAEPRHFGDTEFDEVADALIGRRSIGALLDKHRAFKEMRQARSQVAVTTFNQAAELAPVFGLAGTLIALSQLPTKASSDALLSASIPMAIVTTFYGLLAAHLLFAPVAHYIQRKADHEELQRQKLIDWLAEELTKEAPRHDGHRQREQVAA